jgi:hypothetical protein
MRRFNDVYSPNTCCSGDKIEKNEGVENVVRMGIADVYTGFGGKTWGKESTWKTQTRWKDNIEMDLQEVECEGMYPIDVVQDRDGWRALVNAVRNLRVP